MKKMISVLAITLGTLSAQADQYVRVGDLAISGGGLQLVGTISTATAGNDKTYYAVGWTLIVVGSLVAGGDVARADEMISGKDVWDAMVREASVIARAPRLAKADTAIFNAAKELKIETSVLAKLVLDIDLEVKKSDSKGSQIISADLAKQLFPNGFSNTSLENAFNNMIALASMR